MAITNEFTATARLCAIAASNCAVSAAASSGQRAAALPSLQRQGDERPANGSHGASSHSPHSTSGERSRSMMRAHDSGMPLASSGLASAVKLGAGPETQRSQPAAGSTFEVPSVEMTALPAGV